MNRNYFDRSIALGYGERGGHLFMKTPSVFDGNQVDALHNSSGLSAASFRTDDWERMSK